MSKRIKTKYPGVFYREADRIGGPGKEKVFYVVYKKDGRVLEEKAGRQYADDMTESRASRRRAELIEGRAAPRKQMRLEEERKRAEDSRWTFSRLWGEYKAEKSLKGAAQDESRYRLYLEGPFDDKEPSEIVSLDVDRLRIRLLKSKSPQTVKNTLALLRRIARFGEKKGLCAGLSFQIAMPRNINNIVTEDLSDEQLARLLEALDNDPDFQTANMVRLCLCSGLRRSELLRLQWSHIDFARGFIHIKDPKCGPDQVIPLNDSAREILDKHPHSDSPFIFPGRHGKQKVDPRKALKRIKEAAGLPDDFRPLHGLRHTFASNLASSGQVDLYTLQKLLTHKSPQMTQRYSHLRDEALRKASDLAGSLVQRSGKTVNHEPELRLAKNEG